MLSQAAEPMRALATRCLSTSAAAAAAPAVATAVKSKGLLAGLFGGDSRVKVPLTEPLPGVELPEAVVPAQPTSQMTTLPNGLRIASENTPGASATLGIYVDSGSIYESPINTGVSHLLEYMGFKTTRNRTHLRLVREVEVIGGNVLASASREQMAYNIEAPKVCVPEALEILADAVLNPKFQSWEVAEQLKKMGKDIQNAKLNTQTTVLEGAHSVAYHGGLSRPLICPESSLATLNAEEVAEFYAENYTAPRMVLAAAGVEHAELVKLAEPLMAVAPAGQVQEARSEYVGGDWRQYDATPVTHAYLGFEFKGGWRDIKGAVAMHVLQYLLGGGGSFSTGGPGKGMHSRLYVRALTPYPWLTHCGAINSMYNETGLVGIFSSAFSSKSESMVDVMVKEWQAVGSAPVPEAELERAKAAALSSVLLNLESRAVVAEDIGRQVLTYGERYPVDVFAKEIRSLTAKDLHAQVQKLLKSPPTLAALGDIANIPRYDLIAKRF